MSYGEFCFSVLHRLQHHFPNIEAHSGVSYRVELAVCTDTTVVNISDRFAQEIQYSKSSLFTLHRPEHYFPNNKVHSGVSYRAKLAVCYNRIVVNTGDKLAQQDKIWSALAPYAV